MTFEWPRLLLSLLAVPVLVVAYRSQLRRRDSRRAQLAAEGLVATGMQRPDRWRHVAPVLLIGALTLLLASLARPSATVSEPHREGTVILAFDVSTSMAAKDLAPTRLDAAKAAARTFVAKQPSSIRLGVVAFGDSAVISQQPTDDRAQVLAAIDRLVPQGGTALGRGIVSAISAIAGKPVSVDQSGQDGAAGGHDLGYYGSAAVVLLSDGENTTDPDPLVLAQLASTAGVRIYPVGLGSPQGTVLEVDGFQISTRLDEATLQAIAKTTDGTYYAATDAPSLSKVYSSINLAWTARTERHEITSWFAAFAAVLLLLGASVSVLRSGRVV
ncbi:Ca-activated chloride channel family protein [Phycicoccus badiiscoriae]|uniref:Ca-activated chloride channel family protein n=1 Tax=Pedococcus badiiscoriae TaxID=642776 RepID=A0A852WBT3_9MICO|nr:VWA domain-containing protein [Pedococcus badiiscoriae]NYG06518.1 Ca-activated chloride channel family protein [Pedococcus badiiscoriae]